MSSIKESLKPNTITAIITCIILIITCVVSIVFSTSSLKNQVDNNSENIININNMLKDNSNNQDDFRERMAIVETQYDNIKVQLDRIERKIEVN